MYRWQLYKPSLSPPKQYLLPIYQYQLSQIIHINTINMQFLKFAVLAFAGIAAAAPHAAPGAAAIAEAADVLEKRVSGHVFTSTHFIALCRFLCAR